MDYREVSVKRPFRGVFWVDRFLFTEESTAIS